MAVTAGLPSALYSKKAGGLVSTEEALSGCDYIGLYFSAHWCPPCRQFTPVLSAWNSRHAEDKKCKLIFASNDKSDKEMKAYFGEMSFDLALPYGDAAISQLGQKFKVQGIPTLVVLDSEGTLITSDARSSMIADKSGSGFPYRPPTVEELLRNTGNLTDKAEGTIAVDEVLSKTYLALYFSAHWCPPCRGFTPVAAAWYEALKSSGKGSDFEVVFVSSDKSKAEFNTYMGEMPWKGLPFEARETKAALSKLFDVQGIPHMVLLKKDSAGLYQLDSADLRSKVETDGDGFPWPPKALEGLDNALETINELPTLIAFTDKITSETGEAEIEASLESVAATYFHDGKPSDSVRFAIAKEEHDATESVRKFVGALKDKNGPHAVRISIVHVPAQGRYDMQNPDGRLPSALEISGFAADFVAGKLKITKFKE